MKRAPSRPTFRLMARLRTLRGQILLWTLLPVIVLILGVSFMDLYTHQEAMRNMIAVRDQALLVAGAGRLADSLGAEARMLQAVGNEPAFRSLDAQAREKELAPLHRVFADIIPYDAAGQPAAGHTVAPVYGALAQQAVAGGQPVYGSLPGAETGAAHVLIASPLADGGALVGVRLLPGSTLANTVDGLRISPHVTVRLLDGQGNTLLAAGPVHQPAGGHDLLVVEAPVPGTEWRLVLAEPWQMLVPVVLRYPLATLLVAGLALAIAMLGIVTGVRYVIRPLARLKQRAQRMAWGDFGATAERVGGVQEIADLEATLQQMATQLRTYQTAMRNYVGAVTQAQEEERLRLARELHDETVQSLIALGQQLDRARKIAGQEPDTCLLELEEVRQNVRKLVQDVRRLIGDLRPSYLDDLGLAPAMEMLVRSVPAALQPALEVIGEARRLQPAQELAVYRIAQAALKNAEQHAGAQHVRVQLAFEPERVRLAVEDDGQGFVVPASPDDLARQGHFGILGMRERALLLGGSLALQSQPGQGTRLEVSIPTQPL